MDNTLIKMTQNKIDLKRIEGNALLQSIWTSEIFTNFSLLYLYLIVYYVTVKYNFYWAWVIVVCAVWVVVCLCVWRGVCGLPWMYLNLISCTLDTTFLSLPCQLRVMPECRSKISTEYCQEWLPKKQTVFLLLVLLKNIFKKKGIFRGHSSWREEMVYVLQMQNIFFTH